MHEFIHIEKKHMSTDCVVNPPIMLPTYSVTVLLQINHHHECELLLVLLSHHHTHSHNDSGPIDISHNIWSRNIQTFSYSLHNKHHIFHINLLESVDSCRHKTGYPYHDYV